MIPVELLLSVFFVGMLLLMVAILIDKSLAVQKARDVLRFSDVQNITSAILQYQIDNAGAFPTDMLAEGGQALMIAIPGQVCTNECDAQPVGPDCVDLSVLSPKYLVSIPQDPFFTTLGPSGYYIYKQRGQSSFTVGACVAEAASSIESTR